jgi:tungstate transport system permease protein
LEDFSLAFVAAGSLLLSGDAELWHIIRLSLAVTLSATLVATLLGAPLGAILAIGRFPGRRLIVVVMNGFMGLPPVVVGLFVYLMLSRSGPLGELGLLFTPGAMVIAQSLLITPIIASLMRQVVEDAWSEYREQLVSLGATRWTSGFTLLWDTRYSLVTALLAGFGRAAAEVGAVMIVGGNIANYTRVMTTTIALETSKGDLPLALALGFVLVAIIIGINAVAFGIRNWAQRRFG